ncbi:MAG: hypothetical protein IJR14_09440 [Synergistaceae bacterium]|nr:hypothetical protein [Synergistaceae bacterium]
MRIGRPKIWLCVLFLGLVVLVRYAMRDMRLDVDILREGLARAPGVLMEEIRMEREISGDLWKIKIPWLERQGERISIRSLDVRRQAHEAGDWYLFGTEGVWSNDVKAATLRGLLGTIEASGRVWNLEGPRLDWTDGAGELTFPEGLTLYDAELMLSAPVASMDEAGSILLERGGRILWTKPLS